MTGFVKVPSPLSAMWMALVGWQIPSTHTSTAARLRSSCEVAIAVG
jgi:hypothetical protein